MAFINYIRTFRRLLDFEPYAVRSRLRRLFPVVAIITLTLANTTLLWRLRSERTQHAIAQAQVRVAATRVEVAPSFRARKWVGVSTLSSSISHLDVVNLKPRSKGDLAQTLLYVIAPECIWCARNFEHFVQLSKALATEARIVVISLREEGLAEELTHRPLPGEVYYDVDESMIASYGLGLTPTTLRVDARGRITHRWPGAPDETVRSAILAAFRSGL
jgi:hypothetical protein